MKKRVEVVFDIGNSGIIPEYVIENNKSSKINEILYTKLYFTNNRISRRRFTCRIRGFLRYLFYENNAWFIETTTPHLLNDEILEAYLDWKTKTNKKTIKEFKNMKKEDLFKCHFGLGLYIRNNYLYNNKNLQEMFRNKYNYIDVDAMSGKMIETWHSKLNSEDLD